jgi:signal transduction histidine kinase
MLRIDKARRIPLTNLHFVGFLVLLAFSCTLFRATYVESFRLFAKGSISTYVSAVRDPAALVTPDTTPDFETLERMLGDAGPVAEKTHTCTLAWDEGSMSLWIARHILRVDLCAEIARLVARWESSENVGIRITGEYLVLKVPSAGVLYDIKRPLADMFNHWRVSSRGLLRIFAVLLGSILLTWLVVWWFLIRRMLLLIRNIERGLKAARTKDQFWLLPRENRAQDEIGKLEHSIRKAIRATVTSNRRWQNARRLISHDIRSPLQVLMAMNAMNPDALNHLRRIQDSLDDVPDPDDRDLEIMDLNQFIGSWVDTLKKYDVEQLIVFSGVKHACAVRVSCGALEDALDQLRSNAADFRTADTAIEVNLARDASYVTIAVCNQGPHIKEEHLELIFQHGFTTRPNDDKHLGRGLARARELIEGMDGEIRARNVQAGVEFIIELPLHAA